MFGKLCAQVSKQPSSTSPWLALALDMDECFMNQAYAERRQQIIHEKGTISLEEEKEILIACNEAALQLIATKAAKHYERLYLLFGSKRQDFAIDHLNSRLKGTLSGFLALQIITQHLKLLLPDMTVELIDFTMADISVGTAASTDNIGVACALALEHLQVNPHDRHPQWGGTESDKNTTTYAHSHLLAWRRAREGKTNQIVYGLIDDGLRIRQQCAEFVGVYPQHFPSKMQFNFIDYSGANTRELETKLSPQPNNLVGTLNGNGESDVNFMGNLRAIEEAYSTPGVWEQENFHYRLLQIPNPTALHNVLHGLRTSAKPDSPLSVSPF